jgi:hypothetical protein
MNSSNSMNLAEQIVVFIQKGEDPFYLRYC